MDPQATLLSYFSQEIQSHSTILFGIVAGIFAFFAANLQRLLSSRSDAKRLFAGLALMIMISGLVYTAGRIIVYGQLSYFTIQDTPGPNETLTAYYGSVIAASFSFGASRLVLPYFYDAYGAGTAISLWIGGTMVMIIFMYVTELEKDVPHRKVNLTRILYSLLTLAGIIFAAYLIENGLPANAERDYAHLVIDAFSSLVLILFTWSFPWRRMLRSNHLKVSV